MTHHHDAPLVLESVPSDSVNNAMIAEMGEVARAGFGRLTDEDMFRDTFEHIVQSDVLGIAYDNGRIVGTSMARVVDDRIFNWMGCIVHPKYQQRRLGQQFMELHRVTLGRNILIGHTRTPRILKLIHRRSEATYPIDNDPELLDIALHMPDVSQLSGIAYQLSRYYIEGLYGQADPADGSLKRGGPSMKEQFPGLNNPRNAVIVVARLKQHEHV